MTSHVSIRQEEPEDFPLVKELIQGAFETEAQSDQSEHLLVERLRKSAAFIPELSLVATRDGKIVGHILLSKILIFDGEKKFESLALAPVSVAPKYQNQGIGAALIRKSHEIARNLGYRSIVILGHEKYYPRFGYQLAESFDIRLPFDIPKENCFAVELVPGGLQGVSGMVQYPKEFFE